MATQTATINSQNRTWPSNRKFGNCGIAADAPQYVKTALENGLPGMTSLASEAQASGAETAGRIGIRQGRVSELTVIASFAPGGAEQLRAVCGC